jgi:hypothetical protein
VLLAVPPEKTFWTPLLSVEPDATALKKTSWWPPLSTVALTKLPE